MTQKQIQAFLKEYERRFRERTPATRPVHVLAATRVTWTEMFTWFSFMYGRDLTIGERKQISTAAGPLIAKLRKDYPHERWT